ncbi:transposase [Micromonospora sp. NPDC049679]|uniref:transposase n=1 Tax=Micromonospora sp. NPDC049679 TaxID=3155920 RepID=UPI0034077CF4
MTCWRRLRDDPKTGRSPVDRRKPGSKHHVITDPGGLPLAVTLTGGNRHDVTRLLPLIDKFPPIKDIRGRPRPRLHPRSLPDSRLRHHLLAPTPTLKELGLVSRLSAARGSGPAGVKGSRRVKGSTSTKHTNALTNSVKKRRSPRALNCGNPRAVGTAGFEPTTPCYQP